MRRLVVVSAVLLILALTLPACGVFGVVRGSGKLAAKAFDFTDFSRVQVGYTFNADIRQGTVFSVTVTVDDNLEDYLRVSKSGDTLVLNLRGGYSYRNSTFLAVVTMPSLRELKITGASQATVAGFGFNTREILDVNISGASTASFADMRVRTLDATVSGASTLSGIVDVSVNTDIHLSGASTAELSGQAEELDAGASGASNLRLGSFAVRNARVGLSGASNGTVNASGTLSADISGASHLRYLGDPTLGDIKTSGGSSISRA